MRKRQLLQKRKGTRFCSRWVEFHSYDLLLTSRSKTSIGVRFALGERDADHGISQASQLDRRVQFKVFPVRKSVTPNAPMVP